MAVCVGCLGCLCGQSVWVSGNHYVWFVTWTNIRLSTEEVRLEAVQEVTSQEIATSNSILHDTDQDEKRLRDGSTSGEPGLSVQLGQFKIIIYLSWTLGFDFCMQLHFVRQSYLIAFAVEILLRIWILRKEQKLRLLFISHLHVS